MALSWGSQATTDDGARRRLDAAALLSQMKSVQKHQLEAKHDLVHYMYDEASERVPIH